MHTGQPSYLKRLSHYALPCVIVLSSVYSIVVPILRTVLSRILGIECPQNVSQTSLSLLFIIAKINLPL